MPDWGSFSFAFGPVFALGGVGVLIWLLRRNFSTSRAADDVRAPLIGPLPWREVHQIVERLRGAGLDPNLSSRPDGYWVLVPADDLAAARQVIWSVLPPGG